MWGKNVSHLTPILRDCCVENKQMRCLELYVKYCILLKENFFVYMSTIEITQFILHTCVSSLNLKILAIYILINFNVNIPSLTNTITASIGI
jgi:hypothetical protein